MPLTRYRRDAAHFVTAIPFEWGGTRYETGQPFPAIALGLSEYKRRELWIANKIAVADSPPAPATPVVVPPAAIAAPEPTKPKRARAGA